LRRRFLQDRKPPMKYSKNIKKTKILKIEVPVVGDRERAEGLEKVPRMAGKYRAQVQ
jgi:hypothetical protein